ncbi:MAG: serine protease [Thermotogae bacterium]|nr:serine protease [Thermotogota bacterium]
MPTKDEIQKEILSQKGAAQDNVRRQYLKDLHDYTKRDTIIYASAFTSKKMPQLPPFLMSITNEDIQGFMSALHGLSGENLDLILHSPGGSLEAADQIVQYLRSKYQNIRAIIPQNAMSAATMIACACDTIIMGKHSAIGPIDPQITFPTQTGSFTAPAQAILDDFEKAKEEIARDPKTAPLWVNKIQTYPHGFLTICSNTIDLAKDKVAEWLDAYMFKEIPQEKKKGREIADWLGTNSNHKTHGRPIGVSIASDIGLNVIPLENDQKLQEKVLSVFHAITVTFEVTDCMKFIENHNGKGTFLNIKVEKK